MMIGRSAGLARTRRNKVEHWVSRWTQNPWYISEDTESHPTAPFVRAGYQKDRVAASIVSLNSNFTAWKVPTNQSIQVVALPGARPLASRSGLQTDKNLLFVTPLEILCAIFKTVF